MGGGVYDDGMLGRLRRTTRLDVGLALAFSGMAYLGWALVAGISRSSVDKVFEIFGSVHEAWGYLQALSVSGEK